MTIQFVPQIPYTSEMGCQLNGSSAALFAKSVSGGIECTIPSATGGRGTSIETPSCNVFNTTGGKGALQFLIQSLQCIVSSLSVYLLHSAIFG